LITVHPESSIAESRQRERTLSARPAEHKPGRRRSEVTTIRGHFELKMEGNDILEQACPIQIAIHMEIQPACCTCYELDLGFLKKQASAFILPFQYWPQRRDQHKILSHIYCQIFGNRLRLHHYCRLPVLYYSNCTGAEKETLHYIYIKSWSIGFSLITISTIDLKNFNSFISTYWSR
jgi:hypothetical protein